MIHYLLLAFYAKHLAPVLLLGPQVVFVALTSVLDLHQLC